MKKIIPMLFAFCMLVAVGGAQYCIAAEKAETKTPSAETDAATAEELVKSSELFRQTAKNAVTENGVEEAKSYLKKSNDAFVEGIAFYGTGRYRESIDALSKSTHYAILAIVTVKKHPQAATPNTTPSTELMKPDNAKSRKMAKATHDIGDAETFIGVLKRLLSQKDDPEGLKSLNASVAAYESAVKNEKAGNYDKAIEDAARAYNISTIAINTIMTTRAEVIVFPKQTFADQNDMLEYELKKNDTYVYFARLIIAENSNNNKHMQSSEKLRNEALAAIKAGDNKKAIDLLKESTKNFIDAIKNNSSSNR